MMRTTFNRLMWWLRAEWATAKRESVTTILDRELATYEREKGRLLAEARGKFVLIKGDDVIGTFDTQIDAINDGWRRFGNVPILTKQVVEVEEPVYIRHV